MPNPKIITRTEVDVLAPALRKTLQEHYILSVFEATGCTRGDGFVGKGVIPPAGMERNVVFKTDESKGTYNHHQCLTKWKGKYWFAWDNGTIHEEWPGQRTLIAWSDDARSWSEPVVLADGDEAGGILRNVIGLYPAEDKLYAFVQEKWEVEPADSVAMSIHDNTKVSYRNDLYESEDGIHWNVAILGHLDVMWSFEEPRLTAEGRLLGSATTHTLGPAALLWPGSDPSEKPEVVEMPYSGNAVDYYNGPDEGLYITGESSWYQDDDGRIWMWHRDESSSCKLGVALSEDGGRTWTKVMRTNFPDSMSRIYAGRLEDGRFFIVGNSTHQHMDRNFFAISISEDGATFDKMYQLIPERTSQRFHGYLKNHGYAYPNCLVDGDRLLIGYSVNKEDIECGILDTTKL